MISIETKIEKTLLLEKISSQENEIKGMPQNRNPKTMIDNIEVLTGEMNFRISQENSFIKGMNSQKERAINWAISEIIIPQMQNVVENILARELRDFSTMSRKHHSQTIGVHNSDENKLQNR